MKDVSLYFHIPFCRRRCGYCDFNTFAGLNLYIPQYVKALTKEVEWVLTRSHEEINAHTIYFGGGTPSLLTAEQFASILETINKYANIPGKAEISLEANPETVTSASLRGYHSIGFNRISFGMQSASSRDLQILDRQHTNDSILQAVQWSRDAGFNQINLDLIFGIPNQTLPSWEKTLKLALGLQVEHFSIYSLILEEGTRLKKWVDRGLVEEPDEDAAADMYELTMEVLESAGFQQYEISNWADAEEHMCRHNLQYWRYRPYLGFGAGAHGFFDGIRTENAHPVAEYISRVSANVISDFPEGPSSVNFAKLSKWEQIQEHMMVSLRLTREGISLDEMDRRYSINTTELFGKQIGVLLRQGLLELINPGNRLRLTRRGRLFGNRVFAEFVANPVPVGFEFPAA